MIQIYQVSKIKVWQRKYQQLIAKQLLIKHNLLCSFEYSQDQAILHYPINAIYEHILMTIIQSSLLKNLSNLYYIF